LSAGLSKPVNYHNKRWNVLSRLNASNCPFCEQKELYHANFDAPDAHFNYLSLFSGTLDEKLGNPTTKL
jgi:hypothetical protein